MFNTETMISAFSSALVLSCLQAFVVFILIKVLFLLFPRLTSSMRYTILYICLIIIFCLFHYSWIGLYLYLSDSQNNNTLLYTFTAKHFFIKDLLFFQVRYANVFLGAYIIGFFVHILLFCKAIYKVEKIKSQSGVQLQEWNERFEQLKKLLGVVAKAKIFISDQILIPCTVGFIKPLIFIPTALVNQLTIAQVEAIILHELAHIKRNDYLFNIIQRIMEIVLFFNPFSWLISGMIRDEREFCCDEQVITKSSYSTAYAKALLYVEENKLANSMAMAMNGMNKFPLLTRIKRLSIFNHLVTTPNQRLIAVAALFFITLSLAWTVPYTSGIKKKEVGQLLKSNIEALTATTPGIIAEIVQQGIQMRQQKDLTISDDIKGEVKKRKMNAMPDPGTTNTFLLEKQDIQYDAITKNDEIYQNRLAKTQESILKTHSANIFRNSDNLILNSIKQITAAMDTFTKVYAKEKLFVHTDKPYYAAGDTLWFKSYLFNAANLSKSLISGLLYAELIADSGRVIKRISVPIKYGLSRGQIVLDPNEFVQGTYTLRAYTNWMQNFGEDSFFKKTFYIANAASTSWLVREQHSIENTTQGRQLRFALQLKNPNNQPFGKKDVRWKIMAGKKTLTREVINTTGRIEGSFNLPENLQTSLQLIVEDKANPANTTTIPLKLDQPESIDLQFMPESGHLIAGLPIKVGFKALGANGLSADVQGRVLDSKNSEIGTFKSVYKGMGTFEIIPEANLSYYAEIRLPNGSTKRYPLPIVKLSGTALKINTLSKSDSIKLNILISKDLLNGQLYKLMGFVNGTTYYGGTFKGTTQRIIAKIPKNLFPTGVVHFTLFNDNNQPLNERIVFINHNDNLQIDVESGKKSHSIRDSIPLNILVKNIAGNHLKATFSLSVTDDALVKNDLSQENILSKVLLTSDLKGVVESPAYYFNDTEESNLALDALMLTQGWVGYNWESIFNPKLKPEFKAEPEFKVSGRVLNAFNKPVTNSKIALMAFGKYRLFSDTITNNSGYFEFKKFPPLDTIALYAQAKNPRGKSFNVGIEFDQFKPAKVSLFEKNQLTPWYVNSDSTLLNFVKIKESDRKQQRALTGKNMLDDVVIVGKRSITKSKNLNGPGEADQVISESQMEKHDNITLLQLIEKHVNGFHSRAIQPSLRSSSVLSPEPPTGRRPASSTQLQQYIEEFYFINDKRVVFIVDGIRSDQFFDRSEEYIRNEYYDFVKDALNSVDANDVTGMEVMYHSKYANSYETNYLSINAQVNHKIQYAFIEITTRSGQGLTYKNKPGVAVIRPIPVTWPKQFYKPRYTISTINSTVVDYRSTIHWDSNIYSDANGKAFTSFFASDRPGTYTVIVQGSDMDGLIGYKSIKLNIEPVKK